MKSEILIVEDDQNKAIAIEHVLSEIAPRLATRRANSYQEAMKMLLAEEWWCVLLDMSLPTYPVRPDRPHTRKMRVFGGIDILYHASRRGFSGKVIVVTQFDQFEDGSKIITLNDLEERLSEEYSRIYWGLVYYRAISEDWKLELAKKIGGIENENMSN